ncbi:hypothetical protein KC878_01885 [Candidatus Saccharibacteria bacterium]|nr:hypothetical protein [Candidatus Saccharibacteria bacterium]MCB9821121.1 hypothetical protein [Candidatus Nomurabacteria bacterium]
MDPNIQPVQSPVQPTAATYPMVDPNIPAPLTQVPPAQPTTPTSPQPMPMAKPPINPNSTQNTLDIAEIRDGIVVMNDGSFRAVVMCKSINFDLMSPQEREGVEYAYQGFLNSLYFPIQVFIRSRKVDLAPYIQKLEKIRSEHDNMLLSVLMQDYIYFMEDLSQQTNVMDKMFYVVIPYFREGFDAQNAIKETKNMFSNIFNFNKTADHVTIDEPTLERAKDELRNRVQAVMQGLSQSGVQSLPLDTQELIELYYDSYNPDTATRQQLKDFSQMTAPVVTKGDGQAIDHNLDRSIG